MSTNTNLNPNPLVQYLNKPCSEFTKADIIRYVEDNNISMLNFRYVGGDGRPKTLNFVIHDYQHLDTLLSAGERVDGSSLFRNIEAGSSDLYVIPRYRTAFINPFAEIPTLDILCSYYTKEGIPFEDAPENVLHKAHEVFKQHTGLNFEAMGELEYYLIQPRTELFHADDQRGYHESTPFCKGADLRRQAMLHIAQLGGFIKYGHSEVGNFSLGDFDYEQNELEFMPVAAEDAADQIVISKWILRNLAYRQHMNVTFAPKITTGKAGSGFHIHTRLMKKDENKMIENGGLSNIAKRAIAGFLDLAPSLTAFGNQIPTSYFRLVPYQEAPTNICWGDRNRPVLVRVPLGWLGKANMAKDANPLEPSGEYDFSQKQTVEFRSPDGSANVYYLLAGLVVAAQHGLEMSNALEYAERTYVDVNIFDEAHKEKLKGLQHLPASCWESAEQLQAQANVYTRFGVFSPSFIEGLIQQLKSYNDKNLRQEVENNSEAILHLVEKYYHCG
ncbi:MAG TPA: glutamine synthetase [Bacteroidales bacterium]|nr:glutamine synthetase [Bacteroidales bacterium]